MAIISDISLKINGFNARMSHTLEFYKGDSLTLTFLITHSMIQKVKNYDATQEVPVKFIKSKLLIQTPSQTLYVDDMNNNEDNRCVFHLPSDYTQEIGDYKLQIVLYSNADGEVIHLPDINMSIAEPIALVTLDDNPGTSLLLTLNDDFLTTKSGEKILYSNGTGTTNKSISDLDEKTTVNDEDYLIIETPNSTNKIKYENLIKDLTSSASITENITVTGMDIGGFKNGDVTRVASILTNPKHLPLIYALAFGMPGIPCVYYGSEWGAEGKKENGDPSLRPSLRSLSGMN